MLKYLSDGICSTAMQWVQVLLFLNIKTKSHSFLVVVPQLAIDPDLHADEVLFNVRTY